MKRLIPAALAATLTACGAAPVSSSPTREAWNPANDPSNLRDRYDVRFGALPLHAELAQKPWADSYWPNSEGGIANRWNDPERPDAFSYATHPRAELQSLSEEAMAQLSPAEKYDVYRGRYDYPMVAAERQRVSPNDPSWFGLCHGWAPAALNFAEPKPVTLVNADGIRVPFGASDVKALLLFAQQDGLDSRMTGERCETEGDSDASACRDVNAGTFHVVLANQLGILGQGFVADVSRGAEVWNQPVYGFDSRELSRSGEVYAGAARGTRTVVEVETQMRYTGENGPSWEALPFATHPEQARTRTYRYALELDARDRVIGGTWRGSERPDFLWTQKAPRLTGEWAPLRTIYQATQH
jgi:hypothetical protein